ncbi:MAG: NAD(P)-dependent glycerol-3-phosphate dehydrogenase [Candidatus Omnitrophica bacterium]|nr:NAD(P)-dependent glycerol-3-phosphate dehydrogenase [Candidatus Omnitrophota bacterium]MDD5137344.1 NAD(P)-dependent glycerol-3-phosphate dehydrogenase [Candidatus Omnitrophota bacterium]
MKKNEKIVVLGDGGWGTTLAILLCRKGFCVTLWSPFKEYAFYLARHRTNPRYLKGIPIPRSLDISSDISCLKGAGLVVAAVPSKYFRHVLSRGRGFVTPKTPVVSVIKGIEDHTLMRMTEVIRQVWASQNIVVLSGPTIAQEVARGIPSTAVVSSSDAGLMQKAQDLFMSRAFRIYTNADTVGVELGGSLKNVIAIACGISDGLGFGTNAKAAIVARGLAEISRLGAAMGAKRDTFAGIAGLGDLVTTCFNPLSRNHSVGERIGKGESVKQILSSMKMVAEGVLTARSACALARKFRVSMPISTEIYNVLFKHTHPKLAVRNLMERRKKSEEI